MSLRKEKGNGAAAERGRCPGQRRGSDSHRSRGGIVKMLHCLRKPHNAADQRGEGPLAGPRFAS